MILWEQDVQDEEWEEVSMSASTFITEGMQGKQSSLYHVNYFVQKLSMFSSCMQVFNRESY